MLYTSIFINIIITFTTIILTALITRYYAFRSKLYFVIFSIFDLVKLSSIAKEKVQIIYNSQPLDYLSIIRFLIKNSGNVDINKEQIRSKPILKFKNSTKVIDIEEVENKDNNRINPIINSKNGEIQFDIEYIKRKNLIAFQILAYKDNGKSVEYNDIEFSKGIITNTDIKLLNYEAERFPRYILKILNIIFRYPKLILFFYFLFLIFLVFKGVSYMLYFYYSFNIYKYIGVNTPNDISISNGIIFILLGLMVLFTTVYLSKRLKYREIFYKNDNESKND